MDALFSHHLPSLIHYFPDIAYTGIASRNQSPILVHHWCQLPQGPKSIFFHLTGIRHVSTQHPALSSLFPHSWEALSRHDSQASTQVSHVSLRWWWLPPLKSSLKFTHKRCLRSYVKSTHRWCLRSCLIFACRPCLWPCFKLTYSCCHRSCLKSTYRCRPRSYLKCSGVQVNALVPWQFQGCFWAL